MKSFSLLRTNVGLTTNVKVICDSNYNLYLESIDSIPELSSSRFKNLRFNKNNFFDELVPYLFKDTPTDIAYSIKHSNDESNMSIDFSNQYDDIYQMGARNIIDNKNYKEEYEYFAPLYIFKHHIPKYFIIFRVDGPGLELLSKENFRTDFLRKFKTIKLFDITKKTELGEWVDRCFTTNKSFPNTSLDIDFRNLEFSRWIGIDYNSGGFTYKSKFLEESIEDENTLFDFEKLFFDGYKENKIIHPHIVNFSFLFDDTPATPTSLRKWSFNRYCGFYIDDMQLIDKITPFILPTLKSDIIILEGNILESTSSGDPFKLGYQDDKDMWVEYMGDFYKVEKYIETFENVLTVIDSKNIEIKTIDTYSNKSEIVKTSGGEKIKNDEYATIDKVRYRIISDIDLKGKENLLNKKTIYINSNNQILNIDQSKYLIDNFEEADINLIEIDGLFHNLLLKDGFIVINSDYGFNYIPDNKFEYFINSPDPEYYKFIDLIITNQNRPKSFNIFKLKFTDIKDFDTQIVNNEFSKFEYQKNDDLTLTEEPKMYTTDFKGTSNPATFNNYIFKEDVVLIPASSDYTANLETFRIFDNKLSEIWRKNPQHCRFGFQNSISTGDYPYLLNNNTIHENFNRCPDTNSFIPDRKVRNLDYFYSINSGTTSYINHSLHIERNIKNFQDSSFRFELDKYLNIHTYSINSVIATYSFDYFSYLFSTKQSFLNGEIVKNVKKFSYFNTGDSDIPNITLFKGLKFKIFNVDSITKNNISIEDINLSSSNYFEDYKFSILLSQNLQSIDQGGKIEDTMDWGYFLDIENNSGSLAFKTSENATPSNIQVGDILEIRQQNSSYNHEYNGLLEVTGVGLLPSGSYGFTSNKNYGVTISQVVSGYFKKSIQWKPIKIWEHDVEYKQGDLIIYNDVVYNVLADNTVTDPVLNPSSSLQSSYSLYNQGAGTTYPLWVPGVSYILGQQWVYRQGEYYVRNNNDEPNDIDFWDINENKNFVLWKGRYYKKLTDSQFKPTESRRQDELSENYGKYWREVPDPEDWFAYDNSDINNSNSQSKWDKISMWKNDESYSSGEYVVHDDTLWKCVLDTNLGDEPNKISQFWERIYSFIMDSDFIYSPNNNPIIKIADNYYFCTFNSGSTLDNGIIIYINKKWKNILVNIAINDNTTKNIDNSERDLLYVDSNFRLTAASFIRQINDLDSKYDFSEYTSYVVIEEDGSIKKYNYDNISDLPYFMICEAADSFELRNDSLVYNIIDISNKNLKANKSLVNGKIDNLGKINFYSDIPLAYEINKNENTKVFGINYNKRSNISISDNPSKEPKSSFNITETYYRHSGYYMPIFYDIDLFKSEFNYQLNPDSGEFTTETKIRIQNRFYLFEIGESTEFSGGCNVVGGGSSLWFLEIYDFDGLIFTSSNFSNSYSYLWVDLVNDFNFNSLSYSMLIENGYIFILDGEGNYISEQVMYINIGRDGVCSGPELSANSGILGVQVEVEVQIPIIYSTFDKCCSANYKFDENLTFFGLIKQRIISKINRKENILKLRNNEDVESIFPMLDEFGYLTVDSFIFKSTWDYEYHIECIKPSVINVSRNISNVSTAYGSVNKLLFS